LKRRAARLTDEERQAIMSRWRRRYDYSLFRYERAITRVFADVIRCRVTAARARKRVFEAAYGGALKDDCPSARRCLALMRGRYAHICALLKERRQQPSVSGAAIIYLPVIHVHIHMPLLSRRAWRRGREVHAARARDPGARRRAMRDIAARCLARCLAKQRACAEPRRAMAAARGVGAIGVSYRRYMPDPRAALYAKAAMMAQLASRERRAAFFVPRYFSVQPIFYPRLRQTIRDENQALCRAGVIIANAAKCCAVLKIDCRK